MLIAVIGDCLLDISVRPSGPMRTGADAPAAIRLSPGGQGANVAVWLARRGVSVRLIAPMADEAAGRLLREALDAEGVELAALPAARTGSVVALLDADGERTMLSDRVRFPPAKFVTLLADVSWIHVSGYALRDAAGPSMAAVLAARPSDVRMSIGGGSVPRGHEAAAFVRLVHAADPDLLVFNSDEASALGAMPAGVLTIVTDGEAGSTASGPGVRSLPVPAARRETPVVDTTGAGDAYAASLIAELASLGAWPPGRSSLKLAMERASAAGAAAAGVLGAQAIGLGAAAAANDPVALASTE